MLSQPIRLLLRNPGFAAISALTLALGIGASTAVFSVVNGVLLQPLRFPDPGRIVSLSTKTPRRKSTTPRVTGGDYLDLRDSHPPFAAMSYYFGGEMGVQLQNAAEFTGVYFADAPFFQVFELTLQTGRFFDGNEASGAVVSAAFANRHFGDAARALGEPLHVEGKSYTIVGIVNGPRFPFKAEIWLPAPAVPANLNRTAYNYYAVARLQPDTSLEAAQAALNVTSRHLETAHPSENSGKTFWITPLRDQLVGSVRVTLYLLLGAVLLVLLISCTNVSNLLLARAAARSREMAIRAAMGATRGRIMAQLITESAVLAIAGGVCGVVLAVWGTQLLVHLAPASLPRLEDVRVDGTVLAFALGISLLSALIFGFAPAWTTSRVEISARGVVGGGPQAFRGMLVVAEIALAFVLATGAGLLFRSMISLNSADLGYRPGNMLVMYAHAPANTLDEYVGAGRMFVERLLPQLARLPGVESTGAAMGLPGGTYGSNGGFAVAGKHQMVPGAVLPEAGFRLSSPNYFATMRIPLLQGRDFTARDQYTAPSVAIVSHALVKQVFDNENPIGHQITCGLDSATPMTIVGVVGDVRSDSPGTPPAPELYMPIEQHPYYANELQVIVRTTADPASMAATVRASVHDLDPAIATKFTTLETMVSESIAAPRFRTLLIGTFALVALLLAMAGIYGVMNYLVSQRTSEIGLRMALGAGSADVLRLILRRAWMLASIGLGLGLVLSAATGRLLSSMLFGLKETDPETYVVVIAAVALVATLAAFGPAWRASRIDPMAALREE